MTMTELPVDFDEKQLEDPTYAPLRRFFEEHVDELSFHALPEDVAEYARDMRELRHATVRVVKQVGYGWSVRTLGDDALSSTGNWRTKYDNRTPKAKSYTSFPLPKAIRLAKKEAKKIKIGRYSREAYITMVREHLAEGAED